MAWNEPGGDDKGDKDPWGNRDEGPPDLDEAFRKLQNNLSQMFGGGSGNRGGGLAKNPLNMKIVGLAGVVLFLIYFAMGVYQVDQQERGVVLRFGKAQDEIILPGLHWNPPLIDNVLIENVTQVRSRPHDSEMLTEDENIVKVKMSVSFHHATGHIRTPAYRQLFYRTHIQISVVQERFQFRHVLRQESPVLAD